MRPMRLSRQALRELSRLKSEYQRLGLGVEQVRRLEQRALAKLRQVAWSPPPSGY
jgi:hypothetical protein